MTGTAVALEVAKAFQVKADDCIDIAAKLRAAGNGAAAAMYDTMAVGYLDALKAAKAGIVADSNANIAKLGQTRVYA